MNVFYNIDLHQLTRNVIYITLLKSTASANRLAKIVDKMETQLKHEKAMVRAKAIIIENLENKIIEMGKNDNNHEPTQDVLRQREKYFLVFKEKLKSAPLQNVLKLGKQRLFFKRSLT